MFRSKQFIACLCLIAALVFAIGVADEVCLRASDGGRVTLIKGLIGLQQTQNTGAAFGIFSGHKGLAALVSGAALAAMLAFMLLGRMSLPARLGLAAALTGGAYNLVERFSAGGVTDYFELEFMRFPLFNCADVCVCAGLMLFAVCYLLEGRGQRE